MLLGTAFYSSLNNTIPTWPSGAKRSAVILGSSSGCRRGLFSSFGWSRVAAILKGTSFDAFTAEALLDFPEGLDRPLPERSSGFVRYNWNRWYSIRMPYWDRVLEQAASWYDTLPDEEEKEVLNSEAVIYLPEAAGVSWLPRMGPLQDLRPIRLLWQKAPRRP